MAVAELITLRKKLRYLIHLPSRQGLPGDKTRGKETYGVGASRGKNKREGTTWG